MSFLLQLQTKYNWNVITDFGITAEYKLSCKFVPFLCSLLKIKHIYWRCYAYFSNSSFWSPQNWFTVPGIGARRETWLSFKSTILIRNTLQYAEYESNYDNSHTTSCLRADCLKCGYCRSSPSGVLVSSFVFGSFRFQTSVQTHLFRSVYDYGQFLHPNVNLGHNTTFHIISNSL